MLAWVVAASPVLAEAPKRRGAASLEKLQGAWQVTALEHGGKKSPAKEIASLTLEIANRRFTSRDGADVKEDAEVTRLDGKTKPAEIDLKITAGPDRDKVVRGVWK